ALYTYSRLVADREVVALLYGVTLGLMPAGYRTFKDQQFLVRSDLTGVLLQQGAFTDLAEGLTVYVRDVAPSGALLGILVHDERAPERPITMMAESGTLTATASGPRLVLVNGNRQSIDADGRAPSLLTFERYVLDLDVFAEPRAKRWREPRERYLDELLGPPLREEDVTYARELRAEAHTRLVAPWGAFALAAIALAALLSGEFSRRSGTLRILAAVGVGIGFEGATLVLERAIIDAPGLIPLLYAVHVATPVAAWVVLGWHRWPWRRAAAPA
ncbi:MAG: LptF/LptG family permease, partial [Alphaproteobacteria bacterium]